jgi:hypothetical protein
MEGKWDNEESKDLFILNSGDTIDLSNCYNSKVFELLINNTDTYSTIGDIAFETKLTSGIIRRDLEELVKSLENTSLLIKTLNNGDGFRIVEKKEHPKYAPRKAKPSMAINPPNPHGLSEIAQDPKKNILGYLAEDAHTFVMNDNRILKFYHRSHALFFYVVQSYGKDTIPAEYILNEYNKFTIYQPLEKSRSIKNLAQTTNRSLRKNNVDDIHLEFSYSSSKLKLIIRSKEG